MNTIQQANYPSIEIDNTEKDCILIWQKGKHESNVVIIERESLEYFLLFLKSLSAAKQEKEVDKKCHCITDLAKDRCKHYRAYQCCKEEDLITKDLFK